MSNFTLTATRLRAFQRCQRLHDLRYNQGFRPVQLAAPLHFGTLIHRGLEAWWKAPAEKRLEAALAALASESDAFELAKAKALLTGYDARWGAEDLTVVAVEQEFSADLIADDGFITEWTLAGKIDVLVRNRHGRLLLMEHKTSAEDIRPGSDYWRRLRLDAQLSIYYAGAQALGHEVDGCIYDVLGKPALRPKEATPNESRKYKADGSLYANQRDKDETADEFYVRLVEDIAADPDAYFQRGNVVRLERDLAASAFDLSQLASEVGWTTQHGIAPRNPDACIRYGRACDFLPVCEGSASLSDPMLYTRSTVIHPELSEEAAP